jgi:hypothetical protein
MYAWCQRCRKKQLGAVPELSNSSAAEQPARRSVELATTTLPAPPVTARSSRCGTQSRGMLREPCRVAITAWCCLTPRSTGPATAGSVRLARSGFATVARQPYTACLRGPVTSNVRPQKKAHARGQCFFEATAQAKVHSSPSRVNSWPSRIESRAGAYRASQNQGNE